MNQKKTQKFILCLAAAPLVVVNLLFAQSLPFKHYSIEEGLASASVIRIYQDSSGFLWIGTQHGLSRFDGIHMKNFYARDGLLSDYIADIWEDQRGNLWIGSSGGLNRINLRDLSIYPTGINFSSNLIYSIAGDREGNLWIGTNAGMNKFDGEKFITFTKNDGLIDNTITDIIFDGKGNLWYASLKGMGYFTGRQFINYTTDNGLIDNRGTTLMTDHKGNTWIGTENGISCYHHEKGSITSYSSRDGLAGGYVRSIIEDKNNNIWIATSSGLSFFTRGIFTNFYTKNGLLSDDITAIFEGKEGNIWLGTNSGISRLHSLRFLNFYVQDGLPNNLVWTIIEESKGKYWIGTTQGLSYYAGGKFKNYTTSDGLIHDTVYHLLKDKNGNIWIATGGGVSVYSSGVFTNYTMNDGLPNNLVFSLEEDKDDVIWIGTSRGICRFIEGKITPPPFKQTPNPIKAILQDSKGNVWFSDKRKLYKFQEKVLTSYSPNPPTGLINGEIYSLFEDSRGRIWIMTHRGLSCWENGKFTNYTTADGLSDDACFFMLEDHRRILWIGTGKGVDRYNGKNFKNYTATDGLASSETNAKACLADSSGYLWFGTAKGLSRFNPLFDRENRVPPPVYINGFNVLGKDYPVSDKIVLEYNQNHLQISFIGICLTSPETVSYKYRLEGIDPNWTGTNNRSISYSSLNPGKYTFRVIAKNKDGEESTKPAEIGFTIQPPFWQTWWFRGTFLILILLSAALAVVGYVKKEKAKVANEARNKQLVMAQRMELMGVIAAGAVHDLRNLLSIIIGYSKLAVELEELEEEMAEEEKSEALEIIKETATTAIQLVQQILSFARQRYNHAAAIDLTELVGDILEIIKVNLPSKIGIHWEPPKDEIWLYMNPVQFKQVVMNLSINAIQAMEELNEKGELTIALDKDQSNRIILEVSDTGPGIPREVLDKIFDPLFTTKDPGKGTGLGLFVVKQIVDECKAKIQVISHPGEGATFRITFPPPQDPAVEYKDTE
jgi:ligand-binding sensor domain-containing protein/signal transduction histidine kinase